MSDNSYKFKKYTIGLMCDHRTFDRSRMVCVEIQENESGDKRLQVVSGHNQSVIPMIPVKHLSAEQWDDLPYDPYSSVRDLEIMRIMGLETPNDTN